MKHLELLDALKEAEDKVDSAKTELQNYLFPIIEEIWPQSNLGDIISTFQIGKFLHLNIESYSRGCSYNDEYKIPLSVLNSLDPIAAAKEFKETQSRLDLERKREKTRQEIERLQQKLNEIEKI